MKNIHLTQYLSTLLSHEYGLFYQSQYCHWNVTGANFTSLHTLFEEHYTELLTLIDACAELIRMHNAPVSLQLLDIATDCKLPEIASPTCANEMVIGLRASHEYIIELLNNAPTDESLIADFITRCLAFHTKARWVLNNIAQR